MVHFRRSQPRLLMLREIFIATTDEHRDPRTLFLIVFPDSILITYTYWIFLRESAEFLWVLGLV